MLNKLADFLWEPEENIEKKNMIWNIAGSFCYAFASILLSFLVMRIVGDEAGGIFAFGFSTFGQQMFTVAYFGIRAFPDNRWKRGIFFWRLPAPQVPDSRVCSDDFCSVSGMGGCNWKLFNRKGSRRFSACPV